MSTRISRFLLAAGVSAAVAVGHALPQDAPVFRSQVEGVEIDAYVTDSRGNPVPGLTLDDFELLEGGVPQKISSVSFVNIPIAPVQPPSGADVEPDVFSNHREEGRLYLIALDEMPADLALRTRDVLRRFIERQFGPDDVAAVVHVGRGISEHAQDFTSNRRLLLAAIDRYTGGFPEDSLTVRSRMSQLRELLEFMGHLRGRRKAMLYVTQGMGDVYSVLDYAGTMGPIWFEDLHAAIGAATRGNTAIYPLNPFGLRPGFGPLGENQMFLPSFGLTDPGEQANKVRMARLDQLGVGQDIHALADATGGIAAVSTNNFNRVIERAVRDSSTYYVLSYVSNNDRPDGRYRKVEVRVKRSGLRVQSRKGYVAPLAPAASRTATVSAPLPAAAEVLRLPLMTRTVPVTLSLVPYRGVAPNANVVIALQLDPARLDLNAQEGVVDETVEIGFAAIDARGTLKARGFQRGTLKLPSDVVQNAGPNGMRMITAMELPPGRYQIRVAAGTSGSRRAGSTIADLEVPDFAKGALALSGISIAAASSSQSVTATLRASLPAGLPSAPTTVRDFPAGDTISVYTEAYANFRRRTGETVSLRTELRDPSGRVVRAASEDRPVEVLGQNPGFTATFPLAGIPAGAYVVRVEADAPAREKSSATRSIPITILRAP
jgi:VWFA-related protein